MAAVLCVERNDRNKIKLPGESVADAFEKKHSPSLKTSAKCNLLNREYLLNATINNLINIGILLPIEVGQYRVVLDNYDYNTLIKVFLESEKLKTLE